MSEIFMHIMNDFVEFYAHFGGSIWLLIVLFIILSIWIVTTKFRESWFSIFFENIFEKVYEFFEDILWQEEKNWIKLYVTILFFIILFSNLLWVFLEFFLPIFWDDMHHFATIPSADINFNIAMSIVALIIILLEQFKSLWFKKWLYEYFPILGKNYLPYTRGNLPNYVDIPLFILVKIFDIIISMFLWLLEIVGHIAKIISLSFRLFWNVTSWWVLLAMIFTALWAFTASNLWFNFPILAPIILYLQEILVALIQALVFPLLVSIFIKVSKLH